MHPKGVFLLVFWPLVKMLAKCCTIMKFSPKFGHFGNFLRGFTSLKYKKTTFFLQELTKGLKITPGTNSDTKKSQEPIQQLKAKSGTKPSSSETKLRALGFSQKTKPRWISWFFFYFFCLSKSKSSPFSWHFRDWALPSKKADEMRYRQPVNFFSSVTKRKLFWFGRVRRIFFFF